MKLPFTAGKELYDVTLGDGKLLNYLQIQLDIC